MAFAINLRSLLARTGWPFRTRLGQIASFIFAIDIVLYAAQRIAILLGNPATTLGGWVGFLTFVSVVLFTWLAIRVLREKVLWRLRNRLIVTYVFIAVIPVILLVTLAGMAFYLFAAQFATFIVTSDVRAELKSIEAANSALAQTLAARIDRGATLEPDALQRLRRLDPEWADRQVTVWLNGRPLLNNSAAGEPPPAFLQMPFSKVVRDQNQLFLRTAVAAPVRDGRLIVLSSEPFDQHLLEKLSLNLGEITLLVSPAQDHSSSANTGSDAETGAGGKSKQNQNYEVDLSSARPVFTAGRVPGPTSIGDRPVTFPTALPVLNWTTGAAEDDSVGISVQTRLSVLVGRLFASLGSLAPTIEFLLLFMAIAFALIELIALLIGVGLSRTITRSVANLYRATQHINRGDLGHRIQITSSDQLATLETSFNHMTESLEKLLEEQKQKQRLENELVIAQEVQAQLFPKEISQLESLEVHGFCRPARTVSGDYYDFLALNSHKLTLAVGDVSGKGISAALLMATIHSAVRAYSLETIPAAGIPVATGTGPAISTLNWDTNRGEVSPATMLSLLNHQLYESTPTEKYATLFLAVYDGRSRMLTYSNGGHLPPIILGADGTIRRLEAGGMVVGLFDNMSFDEGTAPLKPGDIFLAYSDGVTEPENDFGEFGEYRLIDLVRENQHLPLVRISEIVSAAVYDWIGANEQPDDITLVLARAR